MYRDEMEFFWEGGWDRCGYEDRKAIRKKNPLNQCEVITFLDKNGEYSGEYLHRH